MSVPNAIQQSLVTLHIHDVADNTSNDTIVDVPFIGNYDLIKSIGSGGMGQVWLARQIRPIQRTVAIKLIKTGLASRELVARFEAERQVLAIMDHASIAKIFDGGATTTGEPYLVMEYVDGIPITDYCEQNNLSLEDRLRLFITVCGAVQHAHQKGIIHRDLKPANILVSGAGTEKAIPKVIDFGLAKVFENQFPSIDQPGMTYAGQILGTPQYMSPEQASGHFRDIDTRSDVYGLGVILYELLTGTTPLAGDEIRTLSVPKILERICTQDAPKPSSRLNSERNRAISLRQRRTLTRGYTVALKRDLDWIVMKALEKDRDRRYVSVSDLAEDVTRFMSGMPIEARPPSLGYRFGKFARKNRLLLGAILFCSTTALLGMISVLIALQETKLKAQAAMAATDILASIFDDTNVRRLKDNVQPIQAILVSRLEKAAAQLDHEDLGDQTRQAKLKMRLGAAMLSLGSPSTAVKLLESAHPDLSRLTGNTSRESLESACYLAEAYQAIGKSDLAMPLLEQSYALAQHSESIDSAFVLETKGSLATTYIECGDFDKGFEMLKQTVDDMATQLGKSDHRTLVCTNNLAFAYEQKEQLDEAKRLLDESLPQAEKTFGESHVHSISTRNNLAKVHYRQGNNAQAFALFETNYRLSRYNLGEGHAQSIDALGNLAQAYIGIGESEKGGELLLKLVDAKRPQYDMSDNARKIAFANFEQRVAESLIQSQQFARAETLLQECLVLRTESHPNHWLVGSVKSLLGEALSQQQKLESAEQLLNEGFQQLSATDSQNELAPKKQIISAAKRLIAHYKQTDKEEMQNRWQRELDAMAQ